MTREQAENWLAEQWSAKLVRILESMTGQRPSAVWAPEGEKAVRARATDGLLIWEQALNAWLEPVIWIAAPDMTWGDLGKRTLIASGAREVETADARNCWLKALNQSLSGLAEELSRYLQSAFLCERGTERSGRPRQVKFTALQLGFDGHELPALQVGFGPVLLQALEGRQEDGSGEIDEVSPGDDEIPHEIPMDEAGPQPAGVSKAFDLLLEVGLPVSISFGRTRLPLRDVLKLTTGSIVELNRAVMEPVEVVVNDCVIARGEVVVVEGNYGVRIRQIISRQERLRTGTGSAQRAQKGATAIDRAGAQD